MNRLYKTFILIIETILAYLIIHKNIIIPCIFKKVLTFSCPACGLTRAFKSLLRLDFINAIKYNILLLPVLIFLLILNSLLIYDIVKNKKETNEYLIKLGRHYKLIIFLLLLSCIINNLKSI